MPEIILDPYRISRRQQFYPFRAVRKNTSKLHRDEWKAITADFNNMLMEEIIYNSFQFVLPYNLGLIFIGKVKIDKTKVDKNGNPSYYPKAKWNKKYFIPKVRTDYIYKFAWYRGRVRNIFKYMFVPSVVAKKKLVSILNDPNNTTDYYTYKK